ncbi:MAG TPA: thioesterase family protein [Acidimicrobiales bacterium]|nr:thioesterase family protein [Acidimicrobiales bacterium]
MVRRAMLVATVGLTASPNRVTDENGDVSSSAPSADSGTDQTALDRRHRSDATFLGLQTSGEPGPTGSFRFTVEDRLSRMDARLYGGTAIAVSIAAAEERTTRPVLWMTTQFVSTAAQGAEIGVLAEVLAPGKRTNQVRITGTDTDGTAVFASLGATGHHREGGLSGEFERMPTVAPPASADPAGNPFEVMARAAGIERPDAADAPAFPRDTGFASVVEMRPADVLDHPDPGPGRICMWLRRKDREAITPAMAAFMADMVPMSVAAACGAMAGGTSLDNSIRIGTFRETEWILLDLRPHLAAGDYGHGSAHIWDEDGHLMATASQTASMIRFDPAQPPPWSRGR